MNQVATNLSSLSSIYEPSWTYNNTTTSGSTTTVLPTYQNASFIVQEVAPLPAVTPPMDASALGWLKGRVREICDAGALV